MNQKLYLLLIISITYSSCQDFFDGIVTDIEVPPHTSQLAPYAFFNDTDSLLSVMVGTSVGILDNASPLQIENANVELFKNGALFQTFTFESRDTGYLAQLTTPLVVQEGDTYELKVAAENYEPVSATQVMPMPVAIENVEYTPEGAIDEFGSRMDEYKITFTDPNGVDNYYEVSIRMKAQVIYSWDTSIVYNEEYHIYTSSLDPTVEIGSLFKDDNINGRTYTLTMQGDPVGVFGELVEGGIYVELRSVTKEYYNYRKSLDTYEETLDDPFAEPVLVYSNMSGSLGIFGLFSTSKFLIEL